MGRGPDILAGNWDKVVLATGAHHTMPPIPGIDSPKVVSATALLTGRARHGRRVVVIGAGLVGCETAAMCAQTAEKVTVLESLPKILMSVDHCRNNEQALDQLLQDCGIEFITDAKVTNLGEDGVSYEQQGEHHEIPADTHVIAAGYTPNDELYAQLIHQVDVSMIGDAAKPDSILTAVPKASTWLAACRSAHTPVHPEAVNAPGHSDFAPRR